jgi:hypothetical protein
MENRGSERDNNQRPFESDTKKLVREHLADPNHVITEEDIKNVRIGMTSELDETTHEGIDALQKRVDAHREENTGQTVTPWDVVDPDK